MYIYFYFVAEDFLSYSFHHCHRSSQKNKRMILIYLLPVKMLLVRISSSVSHIKPISIQFRSRYDRRFLLAFQGHMPTHQLLRKYDLMQFADVRKAVR